METRAGDPGAFARFDLNRVPTPAFVVDEVAVRRNLAALADVKARSGAKVLSALKRIANASAAERLADHFPCSDVAGTAMVTGTSGVAGEFS